MSSVSDSLNASVEELDSKQRRVITFPDGMTLSFMTIQVPLREWSDMNRRVGYLEGVLEMLMGGDAESWVRDAREHYRTVYLGLPVVVKVDEEAK